MSKELLIPEVSFTKGVQGFVQGLGTALPVAERAAADDIFHRPSTAFRNLMAFLG